MRKRIIHLKHKYLPFLQPKRIARRRRVRSKFRFENRQSGSNQMLILVCGYKQILWPAFFERIESFILNSIDICIVCPGFDEHAELEEIARNKDYSILLCNQNKLSIAQNIAIQAHANAELIFKLDEDIIITEHFVEGMLNMKNSFEKNSIYEAGFYAPLININGYSYHRVLHLLSQTDEYEAKFGKAVSRCVDLPAWEDGEAAEFLWNIITPIDETAQKLYKNGETYTICPHRFSIGAMMFTRRFWEDIDYFRDAPSGYLGLEEIQVAEYCARECKQIVVSEEVLVGHFSFGPQYEHMLKVLKNQPKLLKINDLNK